MGPNKLSLGVIRPGVFINLAYVARHLENRKGIKPDQPKTPAAAVAEAQWLYAAETMRGVQTYVKQAKYPGMIVETYGIQVEAFCINLQKYVWMCLGKGSTEGLPWSGDPAWPQSKLISPNYPNMTMAKMMWYDGSDLHDVLQKIGPSPKARFISKNRDHEEDGNDREENGNSLS